MTNKAIEIRGGEKRYKTKEKSITAIHNLSYTFEYGKLYAIMGRSGSGKTTLLNCISMLDNLDCGDLIIDGINVKVLNGFEKSRMRANNIGLIFQNYLLNDNLNCIDNVILPMYLNNEISSENREKLANELLKRFGLDGREMHLPSQLSGGEQQRVAIARSIANNPKIILADEPTGNLDEENEKYIFDLLKKCAIKGKCVIVVSHDEEIKKYADNVIIIKAGEII